MEIISLMGAKHSKSNKNKRTNQHNSKPSIKAKATKQLQKKEFMLIKCTYEIKDNSLVQIINYRGKSEINEEIESKIKILNDKRKENLIFQKKFDKLGINTIVFACEEKLNNMSFMFNNCSTLKKIEFKSFDTSQVTSMAAMFQLCSNLEYIFIPNFNTSNVTDMGNMFYGCNKLKEIKGINNFNTINVKTMSVMFGDCNELKYLNLSNFNTSKVNYMDSMFADCHELQYLDLSNFNIKETYDTSYMFGNCNELTIVKGIENFDINHLNQEEINTEGMFEQCNKFKGYKELMLKLKNKENFNSEEASNKLNDNYEKELETNNLDLREGNNYLTIKLE